MKNCFRVTRYAFEVASVLLYVEAEALRALRGGRPRSPGATWPIAEREFPQPQLGLLDDLSTLFVVTVEGNRAVVAAVLDGPDVENHAFHGGDAVEMDADITHLLPRLGCNSIGEVPAWARVPRIVPPDSLDLLRYELQLGAPSRAPEPPEMFVDDDKARELRAAVYRDPDSDVARAVYADYLQDRGDPRGELIALQLARAASRTPPTDRERVLIARHGASCVGPLVDYLKGSFELRRGFLASCAVDDRRPLPEALTRDPAWSTVETIDTSNAMLLASGALISARRVATHADFGLIAETRAPSLRYEVIAGRAVDHTPTRVLWGGAQLREWGASRMNAGAFEHLRVLSVEATAGRATAALIRSELAARLEQLDFVVNPERAYFESWRFAFERSSLRRLSYRFVVPMLLPVVVALERHDPRLIIEVGGRVEATEFVLDAILRAGRESPSAEVRFTHGTPVNNGLVEQLRPSFSQLVVVDPAPTSLAP